MTSKASTLFKSIPLITNPCCMAFTYSSKYCESIHFLSELCEFSGASILIPVNCFDNFFCPDVIDTLVVDSHYSCSTDFTRSPCCLFFHCRIMFPIGEVLQDPLLLEAFDPLLSGSCLPLHCLCWLFPSTLVSLSPKSLSASYCCHKVPGLVADIVVNITFVEILGTLLLPLHSFRIVNGSPSIPP